MNDHPTLPEIMEGYRRFNAWEHREQKRELAQLTVEESLTQFFQLCDLARTLAPDTDGVFFEQDKAHWTTVRKRLQKVAQVMGNARTVHGSA